MEQKKHTILERVIENEKRQRQKLSNRLAGYGMLVFFLIGAGIAAYPYLSNKLAVHNSIEAIQEYQKYTTSLSEAELEAEWEAAEKYNHHLMGDPVEDPFIPKSGMALPENYEAVLNIQGDGIMGYLEIPSVNIELLIGHGTSEETLKRYAGHIEQTALPIGGKSTHAVLTAHTGLPSARLFTDIIKLEEGDYFYLYILDKKLSYQVDQIDVILPEEIETLRMVEGEDYVTLLTCTPYGINSHRLLVRGIRVPNEEEEAIDTAADRKIIWILLTALLFFAIAIIVRRKRKKGSGTGKRK